MKCRLKYFLDTELNKDTERVQRRKGQWESCSVASELLWVGELKILTIPRAFQRQGGNVNATISITHVVYSLFSVAYYKTVKTVGSNVIVGVFISKWLKTLVVGL